MHKYARDSAELHSISSNREYTKKHWQSAVHELEADRAGAVKINWAAQREIFRCVHDFQFFGSLNEISFTLCMFCNEF